MLCCHWLRSVIGKCADDCEHITQLSVNVVTDDLTSVIKAYEALVEEKGRNVIYLRLSSRCVSDLQLSDGDNMTCMVI